MATNRGSIPAREISRLVEGSYEQLAVRVSKAVAEAAPKLQGINESVEVVGVFNGYAVAVSEDGGRAFRVKYEIAENKSIKPISAEQISIKAVTPDEYALSEARAFVNAFINGARTEATEHLQNLLPAIQERKASDPAKLIESFNALVRGERGWKKVFTERESQIREAAGSIEEAALRSKFHKLYDGSTTDSELPAYRDLVTSDMKYLGERVEAVLAATEKAIDSYKGAVPALKTESTDTTIQMFESFAEDYVADLRGVKKALSEASDVFNRVDELGKIYDVLASELHRYEVAGRFVEKMSRSLSEAATEEG